MVGRTPEFLGKKIERREVQFAILGVLVTPVLCLVPTAIAALIPAGLATLGNSGPHGFSEILYAFTSTNANNGSAFAGLGPNTFYNVTTGVNMLFGRFAVIVPALALGGSLAGKKAVAQSVGTFTTNSRDLRRAAAWRDRHRRRADLRSGRRARTNRRTPADSSRKDVLMLSSRRIERRPKARALFDREIVLRAVADSFKKLDPRWMMRNPVMFIVEVSALVTSIFWLRDLLAHASQSGFDLAIALWLWFTVLFANFAEAVAEGRGKAQADFLRRTKSDTTARRWNNGVLVTVASTELRKGDVVEVAVGEIIPGDGEVVQGAAMVDESAITGESAPVVREAGGDRSSVTGGTRVLSDVIQIKITANPGETFLDRMIDLVEGAQRQKTPNEIALSILLSGLTIVFLVAVATLLPYSLYAGARQTLPVLIALLVCLIPTTIGGLLSAIGIAGMDRVMQRNVLATSGRAVEAAGDVDTLLLDKTGTITLGNRQATEIVAASGIGRTRRHARRLPFVARRRDARRAFDRHACARERHRRAAAVGRVRAVQRVHAHERRRSERRREDSQRRARFGARVGARTRRRTRERALARMSSGSRAPAARRCCWLATRWCSASSISRISSNPTCANASIVCARWAFAR